MKILIQKHMEQVVTFPTKSTRWWLMLSQGLVILLLSSLALSAESAAFNAQNIIQSRVHGFVVSNLRKEGMTDFTIKIDRLDSRLKLSRCTSELAPWLPSGVTSLSGKLTVGVRCSHPKPWSVYVPVQVDIYQNVLVAARPMLRGQSITASDIKRVRQKTSAQRNDYFLNPTEITGMVIKRFVAKGKVFTARLIAPPRLVRQGEEVTLLAGTKSLVVRMVGKALADGARGDRVQVRNMASNRVVEGIVTGQGTVRVKM